MFYVIINIFHLFSYLLTILTVNEKHKFKIFELYITLKI